GPTATSAPGPKMVKNASLDVPSPRGAARGSRLRVALTGEGVGRATALLIPEPGITASIVPAEKTAENRVNADFPVAEDARAGLHALSVVTLLGVPPFQVFAVAADPERAEAEPNDRVEDLTTASAPAPFPATLLGTIDRPGDVDLFAVDAKAGQELI